MQMAGLGADGLAHLGQEGDDVMVERPLQLVDPGHVDPRPLADSGGDAAGNLAATLHRLRHGQLHLEPVPVARLVLEERRHLLPAVARDHGVIPPASLPAGASS